MREVQVSTHVGCEGEAGKAVPGAVRLMEESQATGRETHVLSSLQVRLQCSSSALVFGLGDRPADLGSASLRGGPTTRILESPKISRWQEIWHLFPEFSIIVF